MADIQEIQVVLSNVPSVPDRSTQAAFESTTGTFLTYLADALGVEIPQLITAINATTTAINTNIATINAGYAEFVVANTALQADLPLANTILTDVTALKNATDTNKTDTQTIYDNAVLIQTDVTALKNSATSSATSAATSASDAATTKGQIDLIKNDIDVIAAAMPTLLEAAQIETDIQFIADGAAASEAAITTIVSNATNLDTVEVQDALSSLNNQHALAAIVHNFLNFQLILQQKEIL